MITFSFYRVREKKPKNGEEIVLLGKRDSFGFECYETELTKVWYNYEEIGEDGLPTGDSWPEPYENCIEVPYCGNKALEDDDYWCTVDEYWNAIDDDKEMKQ